MLKIEQTEFWTETASPRMRAMGAPIPSAAEDYFLDEAFEAEPTPADADAVEAIVVPEDDASPSLLDVSESIDSIERRLEASESEADEAPAAVPVAPREPVEARLRPRGTVARRTYAQQDAPQPRFNMTRLLRLTGSLDAVDDREHWYDLPRRHVRAIFTLLPRRSRISQDFFKDLSAPPRGVTIRKHGRTDGWLTLK